MKIETRYELLFPAAGIGDFHLHQCHRPADAAPTLPMHSYFKSRMGPAIFSIMKIDDRCGILSAVDAQQNPTGEIATVEGTDFDFVNCGPSVATDRTGRFPMTTNFCLSSEREEIRRIALARSIKFMGGIAMELRTTEPGLQFLYRFKNHAIVQALTGSSIQPAPGVVP